MERARAVAIRICHERGEVTADDVREYLGIPANVHHNAMGSVFRRDIFECVGWRSSSQPQRHANRIGIWRLKEGEDGRNARADDTAVAG